MDTLIIAIVFGFGISARGPVNDVLQAKAYLVAGGDDAVARIEEVVFAELFEVPMLMACGPEEERVGVGISHNQIAGAQVARLGSKAQQGALSDRFAALNDFAIIAAKRARDYRSRRGVAPDHQIRQCGTGLVPIQQRNSCRASEAIDGDVIGRAGGWRKRGAALPIRPAGDVVVAHDEAQSGNIVAGVNRQQGVEGAAQCVERHGTIRGSSPAEPKRVAAGIARVIGFTRFFGGVSGLVRVRAGRPAQRGARCEEVAQAKVLRKQFLLMLRQTWFVRVGTDIVRCCMPDPVKLDLVIATRATASHLHVEILVAEAAAPGN